jgi:hypothetical protein
MGATSDNRTSTRSCGLMQRSVPVCAALALLALVSACGSKSSTGTHSISASGASATATTAFVNRANAICTKPQTGPSPGPFPFPSFDPLHPDRSKLPAIGRYFQRANALAVLRGQIAQLRALGAPPKDHPDWQRLLAAMQSNLSASASQIQAALRANVAVFIATVKTVTTTMSQERAAATAFGANGCAPPGPNARAGPPPGARAIPPQARRVLGQLAACMRANGIAVQANTSVNGPPLITRVSTTDPKYQSVGAKCRAQLASRFPGLARTPTPP